jgi:hypothetical protein
MSQADQNSTTDNITPLRPKGAKSDPTSAQRQARFRKKRKGIVTVAPSAPPAPITLPTPPPHGGRVDIPVAPRNGGVTVATQPQPSHANRPLVALAYGFFGLGIGINGWNAWTGGALIDMALPAALGVLAEGVVFFLPSWAMTLPLRRQLLAWALMVFVSTFALTNSLRMASIIAADQAALRADRQTAGVTQASKDLEAARAKRDEACGRGLGKTVACQSRQSEVTKLEAKQTQVTIKVTAQAKPESADFAKLVKWVSFGRLEPKVDDFDILWLLFRTLLPQIGGLVLMLAKR